MNNNKYFSAEKIYSRLNRNHKRKMSNIQFGDILEWCAEIEIEVIGSFPQFERYEDVELEVVDGKSLLPCYIYRLLDVFTEGRRRIFNFQNNGTFISYSENSNYVPANGSKVLINFLGIPVDVNTGHPLFLKGHEQALYWGCVVRMYEEDYASQKIHPNIYEGIAMSYEAALGASDTGCRHVTKNDIKEYTAVVMNAIQRANILPLNKV